MRSSFTAMALAFGIVTMTALPAMAFTLNPEKVEAQAPNDGLPAPGAESAVDEAMLGKSLDLGAGLPTLPTAPQGGVALRGGNVMQQLGDDGQRPAGVEIGEIKVHMGTQDMNPSAARSLQATPAIQAMPPSIMPPSIMPPSIKPTQGIQGQNVAPAARTLQ